MRLERGITLLQMAKLLGFNHASGYHAKESGRVRLNFDEAIIIADKFGIPVEDLKEEE